LSGSRPANPLSMRLGRRTNVRVFEGIPNPVLYPVGFGGVGRPALSPSGRYQSARMTRDHIDPF
jgi:hypothetical protein